MYLRAITIALAAVIGAASARADVTERCAEALSILIAEEIEFQIWKIFPDEFPLTLHEKCLDAKLAGIERNDCPAPPSSRRYNAVLAAQWLMERTCASDGGPLDEGAAMRAMERYLRTKESKNLP